MFERSRIGSLESIFDICRFHCLNLDEILPVNFIDHCVDTCFAFLGGWDSSDLFYFTDQILGQQGVLVLYHVLSYISVYV